MMIFKSSNMMCPCVCMCVHVSSYWGFSELSWFLGLMFLINIGILSAINKSNIVSAYSLCLFSILDSNYMYVKTFDIVLQFLDTLLFCYFVFSLFSLFFFLSVLVWVISVNLFASLLILFLPLLTQLLHPSKTFFLSVPYFFSFLAFSFDFYSFHLFAKFPQLLMHVVYIFL